jgi:hypothetical protein
MKEFLHALPNVFLLQMHFTVKVSEKLVAEYKKLIEENGIDFDNVQF